MKKLAILVLVIVLVVCLLAWGQRDSRYAAIFWRALANNAGIEYIWTGYVKMTTLQIGDSQPFSDSSGTLTLQNIDALDSTSTATILSKMTTETQHHIGCLTTSDMSKVKVLFLNADAGGSTSMYHYHVWYDFAILTITGALDEATITFNAIGYTGYENNFTVEDTSYIVGSTDNDGTYTFRLSATRDGDIISVYPNETLNSDTADGSFLKMHNGVYSVPTGKVFLAGRVSHTLTHGYDRGLIGESATSNGTITKQQMCFGNGESEGGNLAGEVADIPGVFTTGKYVSVSVSGTYGVYRPTLLYGVEVAVDEKGTITDGTTVRFDIGGYVCEDYRDLKVLIYSGDIADSATSFHYWNGSNFDNDYVVGDGKVYIAGTISYWTEGASAVGTVGESTTANGAIAKKIFCCGNTDIYSGLQNIYGIFTAGKYISATCSQYNLRAPTYIYGVEIDE